MSDRLLQAINELQKAMDEGNVDPRNGLPEELFWFGTTLVPCANIDLFIVNAERQVLLTWRDDQFYGTGWHIPGGCIRIQETLDTRIQKTALSEIGCAVVYDTNPIVTRESFVKEERPWLKNQLQRSHNISLLYRCNLPEGYEINNGNLQKTDAGYKKWFGHLPDNLLSAHKELYGDILTEYFNHKTLRGIRND